MTPQVQGDGWASLGWLDTLLRRLGLVVVGGGCG